MNKEENKFERKSTMLREGDYTNHIMVGQGVTDYDTFFDNEFSKDKFTIKFIRETLMNIKKGIQQIPKDFNVNYYEELYIKLDMLWNGECFYAVYRKPDYVKTLFFEDPRNKRLEFKSTKKELEFLQSGNYELDEVFSPPLMKNLTPIGKIADDTLFIKTHQRIPFRYAFEGSEYATIVNDGDFIHHLKDGSFPKFERSDMTSLTKMSYVYSRHNYDKFMNDYELAYNTLYADISGEHQRIIDAQAFDYSEDDEKEFERKLLTKTIGG